MALANLIHRGKALLKGESASEDSKEEHGFTTAGEGRLFPAVDPAVDGEDCLHDCDSCTIRLPSKFKIDEEQRLYGHVKGWATHLLVATGKTDWVREVEDERGSVMEALGKCDARPKHGRLMLSACNMPPLDPDRAAYAQPARCLLLPVFAFVDGVTPANVRQLVESVIDAAPTNTTLLPSAHGSRSNDGSSSDSTADAFPPQSFSVNVPSSPFTVRACPHDALILLCSQGTRDARCGQSAPLLRREFERHLRPLGLQRDADDMRPGGVGIHFISHVGGHKFSANVMVYRRAGCFGASHARAVEQHERGANGAEELGEEGDGSAAQCIWLARVRPNECEGIVRFTVLQGKVVKPERQLRGGFDRERGLCSW